MLNVTNTKEELEEKLMCVDSVVNKSNLARIYVRNPVFFLNQLQTGSQCSFLV